MLLMALRECRVTFRDVRDIDPCDHREAGAGPKIGARGRGNLETSAPGEDRAPRATAAGCGPGEDQQTGHGRDVGARDRGEARNQPCDGASGDEGSGLIAVALGRAWRELFAGGTLNYHP
jgi:hypothetical protein